MQFRSLFLVGFLAAFMWSCQKNGSNDTQNTTTTPRSYFKLKTIKEIDSSNGALFGRTTTNITIDSINNKVVFNSYDSAHNVSHTETYTFNSNNQLTLYEQTSNYTGLYISKMQFFRNNNGELTKVYSEYKNGLIATSEGTCQYVKKQDTTFITFIDSTQKEKNGYPDANDDYTVGIVNNKVVYNKYYYNTHHQDTVTDIPIYDASGALTAITETYKTALHSTLTTYNYQRGSQAATDQQKFIAYMGSDIFWFTRSKAYGWDSFLEGAYQHLAGNVLQSITQNNAAYRNFTTQFDANGNLIRMVDKNASANSSVYYQYEYWP